MTDMGTSEGVRAGWWELWGEQAVQKVSMDNSVRSVAVKGGR